MVQKFYVCFTFLHTFLIFYIFTINSVFAGDCITSNSNKLIMRVGPGTSYKMKFIYELKHLPFRVLSEFENWLHVCDIDNDCGWVYRVFFAKSKYVITLKDLIGRRYPYSDSKVVAKVGSNVLLKVRNCRSDWCFVSSGKKNFWINNEGIWGCK